MDKKRIIQELMILFWIFIIGSILGYIFENILVLIQKGYFELRQGLIYGPFIPVYGIGGMIYYIIFEQIKTKNKIQVFLISMVLGGVTEYICSFIQEKAFQTISWDYSYLIFDINGRTSLLHCTYWGIAGVLYIMFIKPFIAKLKLKVNNIGFQSITLLLVIFMIFNIIISWMACKRQTERKHNILADSKIDMFLDTQYPDEYIDSIFTNKKDR